MQTSPICEIRERTMPAAAVFRRDCGPSPGGIDDRPFSILLREDG